MTLQQRAWPVVIKSYYFMILECSADKAAQTLVLYFPPVHKVLDHEG